MKLLAVNGSPRKNKNTAQLLNEIVAGAASRRADTELVHLIDLNYSGCVSCFLCKRLGGKSYGRCAVNDDLAAILRKAHEADVLVVGTPFYFCAETASTRAFLERLWFQYYLYSAVKPPLSPRKKATALVYTMNVPEEKMETFGKTPVVNRAKSVMEHLFAPCEVLLCCDTKQFDDYSQYDTDIWDVSAKLKRHEEVFPQELAQAHKLGESLVS